MRTAMVLPGLILVLVSSSSVEAQVTIDASKITCEQFVHSKVSNPRTFVPGSAVSTVETRPDDFQSGGFRGGSEQVRSFLLQREKFQHSGADAGYRAGNEAGSVIGSPVPCFQSSWPPSTLRQSQKSDFAGGQA